jgi:DNA-binding MarR family transcriptional regulator
MNSVASTDAEASRAKRKAINAIIDGMREMAVQMTVLNLRAGEQVGLRDIDLKCMDILMRDGAQTASALARRVGMHPATMTGILDRLEKGGWVVRERDPEDRRAVLIKAVREKTGDIVKLFLGINAEMTGLLESYDQRQLAALVDFVQQATDSAKKAAAQMGDG